jgi:hypothetical protein
MLRRILVTFVLIYLSANPALASDENDPNSENNIPGSTSATGSNSTEQLLIPGSAMGKQAPVNSPNKIGKLKSLVNRLKKNARSRFLQYYFVAQNDANCEVFYGLVQDDSSVGIANVNFAFPNGCLCHGRAMVTYCPPSGYAGEHGKYSAKCSDGRQIFGKFTTTSLTTGYAEFNDSFGNTYRATFGHTIDEAVQSVNEIRRTMHCSDCDPQNFETAVQGQLLRR